MHLHVCRHNTHAHKIKKKSQEEEEILQWVGGYENRISVSVRQAGGGGPALCTLGLGRLDEVCHTRKAICFLHSTDLNVKPTHELSQRHQNNVQSDSWVSLTLAHGRHEQDCPASQL